MKLTKTKLKQIIKEELNKVLSEATYPHAAVKLFDILDKVKNLNSNEDKLDLLNAELAAAQDAGDDLLAKNIQMHIDRLSGESMEPEVPESPEL